MAGIARFTMRISTAVTPETYRAIKEEALRRHRTFSDTVRLLFTEALEQSELPPNNGRQEFEIKLEPKDVSKLKKLGYELTPLGEWKQLELSI